MAAGDIFRLSLNGSFGGQEIVNTLDFRQVISPSTPSGEPEVDLINAWQAACQVTYLAILPVTYQLASISCQQVCGATKPYRGKQAESVGAPGTNGVISAAAPWLSSLAREHTAFAGRSYAGRFYVPVLDESYFNGTSLESTYNTKLNAFLTALGNAFKNTGTDTIWDLVVFSKTLLDRNPGSCGAAAAAVTSLSASAYLTTQRSRRSRSGA